MGNCLHTLSTQTRGYSSNYCYTENCYQLQLNYPKKLGPIQARTVTRQHRNRITSSAVSVQKGGGGIKFILQKFLECLTYTRGIIVTFEPSLRDVTWARAPQCCCRTGNRLFTQGNSHYRYMNRVNTINIRFLCVILQARYTVLAIKVTADRVVASSPNRDEKCHDYLQLSLNHPTNFMKCPQP